MTNRINPSTHALADFSIDYSTHPTIQLTQELIARPSITPEDQGCQDIIAQRLAKIGFEIEYFNSGKVTNLWARWGKQKPLFCFAGHTDVVPPGPLDQWTYDPFEAKIQDGLIYGRGAADMKSGIAAMVVALEQLFADQHKAEQLSHKGSIALLITSDEEGEAVAGTKFAIEQLNARGEVIDWCLVGEPSSTQHLGDTIKNGRRGSITAKLKIIGKQGHVAYPHMAVNPIHSAVKVLDDLAQISWDQGNLYYPPSSLQIVNIQSGVGAYNVIPGSCSAVFNLRFSTEQTPETIQQKIAACLDTYALNYTIDWTLGGLPFITKPGALVNAVQLAIKEQCQTEAVLSTSGGTSDGRFIAPTGAQVVEFGVINKTIHQRNEAVSVKDVIDLTQIYQKIIEKLFLL